MSETRAPRLEKGRVLAGLMFLALAWVAVAWWRGMPRGFPPTHPRFWINEFTPCLTLALALLGLGALVMRWRRLFAVCALSFTAAGAAAQLSSLVFFPRSHRLLPLSLFILVLLLVLPARALGHPRLWGRPALAAVLIAALLGGLAPLSQRAPDPGTRPSGPRELALDLSKRPAPGTRTLGLPGGTEIDLYGRVRRRFGDLSLNIEATLELAERSRDRFWTHAISGRAVGRGPYSRWSLNGTEVAMLLVESNARPERSFLRVTEVDRGLEIEALTALPAPVFSHSNRYTRIEVEAPERAIEVGFGPCPELRLPLESLTDPVCFATWQAGRLKIYRADQQEKGPFTLLDEGPLARGAPLDIRLYLNKRAAIALRFEDWSAQLSEELSPAAGWGVPVNAIALYGRSIVLSLADTGIGRGYDSVGHAAGGYRNRISLTRLDR